jgi:hypothetical protein
MSEPIPIAIPIRTIEESGPAADELGADVAITEAIAEVLVRVVITGADVVRGVAAQRGVPSGGPSDRLLDTGAGLAIEAILTMGAWLAAAERSAADLARTSAVGRSITAHGRSAWDRARTAEDDAAGEALRSVVEAVLERLDLTEVVRAHVDLDAVVEDLDPAPIVARVDIDALVNQIDVGRLVERMDVDALAARLDVGAVIARVDLAALATQVIEELDLPELIRETAGDAASDEVRELRLKSVEADRLVQRAVDRVLGRRREP